MVYLPDDCWVSFCRENINPQERGEDASFANDSQNRNNEL